MKNHTPRGGIIERNGNGSTFGIHMSSYQNSQTFSSTNRGSAGNIYTSAAQTSVVGPSFGHRPNSASRIFDPSSKTVTGSRIVLRETNLCDDISRDSDQSNLSGLLTAKDLTRLLSDSGPSPSRHRSQCKRRQRRNGSGYGSTSTFSTKEKRAKKKEYNFNNRLHLLPSETRKTKVLWGHREKADISTHRRIERFETRAVEGKEGDVYYDLEKDDDDYEAKEMDSDDEYRLDAKRFNSLTPMTSSFVTTRWHAVPSAISHREMRAREGGISVAYFFSSPLVDPSGEPLPILNTKRELVELKAVLSDGATAVRLTIAPATIENFKSIIAKGVDVIHFSGHGDPRGRLMFESGVGKTDLVSAEKLLTLLAGITVELFFISACHSALAAKAIFERKASRCVVAVRSQYEILDSASLQFSSSFYSALLGGHSVASCFRIGSTHTLCDEFVLIGDGSAVPCPRPDAAIMDRKKIVVVTPYEPTVSNCNLPSEHFLGRASEVQSVVAECSKVKAVTILGLGGVGKTQIALKAAQYMSERHHFSEVTFVDLPGIVAKEEDGDMLRDLARELRLDFLCDAVVAKDDILKGVKHRFRPFSSGKKRALVILDGCDAVLSKSPTLDASLRSTSTLLSPTEDRVSDVLLTELTAALQNVGVNLIVTARNDGANSNPLGGIVKGRVLVIRPMRPSDGAVLFMKHAPRNLRVSELEFGASQRIEKRSLQEASTIFAKTKVMKETLFLPAVIVEAAGLVDISTDVAHGLDVVGDDFVRRVSVIKRRVLCKRKDSASDAFERFLRKKIKENVASSEERKSQYLQCRSAWLSSIKSKESGAVGWRAASAALRTHFASQYPASAERRPLSDRDIRVLIDYSIDKKRGIPFRLKDAKGSRIRFQEFVDFWISWWMKWMRAFSVIEHIWIAAPWNSNGASKGLLLRGFVTDKESKLFLRGRDSRTFLLRFSCSRPGCLAVDYVGRNKTKARRVLERTLIEIDPARPEFRVEDDTGQISGFRTLEALIRKVKLFEFLYPDKPKKEALTSTHYIQ
eukprot:g2515.t1